jgi:DNA-binding transcriptional MerR regulator
MTNQRQEEKFTEWRSRLLESFLAPHYRQTPTEIRRKPATSLDEMQESSEDQSVEITGVYIISVAARLTDMHPQTLRKYERVGLVSPERTEGSLRLYSEQDLARLRLIRVLTEKFDLNLAGVRMVMELVTHLHHVLDNLERAETQSGSQEGRGAVQELRGILESIEGD